MPTVVKTHIFSSAVARVILIMFACDQYETFDI